MVDQETAKCILDACHGETDWFLDQLQQLVGIETPPHEQDKHRELFEHLGLELEKLEFRTALYPGNTSGGQLLARKPRQSANRYQLLLGHIDTVWPENTLDNMPYKVDDNTACGPGTYDMKAGITMMLTALKVLQNHDLEPPVQPVLFINSDEETGSRESKRRIKHLARVMNRAYVLEPSLGEKGKIKTRRKGVGHFVIKVKGKSSHAGLEPEKGKSAILELSYLIQKLFEINDPENGITVNVGKIDGGVRTNVVAAESSADVDVRVLTKKDARQIEKKIKNLDISTPGISLDISGKFGREPMVLNKRNRRLWNEAQKCGKMLGLKLENGISGGASDGNLTSQFTATLDGLGAVGLGAHSADEKIFINETIERTALLALLLLLPDLENNRE